MSNPFFDAMDETLRGRRARVITAQEREYRGWVDRIHHKQRSVLLQDATLVQEDEERDVGAVLAANAVEVAALESESRIERIRVDAIEPSPYHQREFSESANRGYVADVRDTGYVGSYPVARPIADDGDLDHPGGEGFEIIEGHKRIWACRQAGIDVHPVKVVNIDDWTATRRFVADHFPDPGQVNEDGEVRGGCYGAEDLEAAIDELLARWGDRVLDLDRVAWNADRLGLDTGGLDEQSQSDAHESQPVGDEPATDEALPETGDDPETESHAVDDLPEVTAEGDPFHGESADVRLDESADVEETEDDHSDSESRAETEVIGEYTANEYSVAIAKVGKYFDSDRVTVVKREYGADLVPGTEPDGPDYAVSGSHVSVGGPGMRAIGVEEGDEFRAVEDRDQVRLELLETDVDDTDDDGDSDADPDSTDSGTVDEDDGDESEQDRYWCGSCGAGPFQTAEDVEEHHDREGHPGEPIPRGSDPAESELFDEDETEADDDVVVDRDVSSDGGGIQVQTAAETSTGKTGASTTCQNCGAHVTADYARVWTPEDEPGPRVCPECTDKVRERDGTVRDARSTGGESR